MRELLFKALELDYYGTGKPTDKILYGMPARITMTKPDNHTTETVWVMDQFQDCGVWANQCISTESLCQFTGMMDSGGKKALTRSKRNEKRSAKNA
jgi:hypothetical protein